MSKFLKTSQGKINVKKITCYVYDDKQNTLTILLKKDTFDFTNQEAVSLNNQLDELFFNETNTKVKLKEVKELISFLLQSDDNMSDYLQVSVQDLWELQKKVNELEN